MVKANIRVLTFLDRHPKLTHILLRSILDSARFARSKPLILVQYRFESHIRVALIIDFRNSDATGLADYEDDLLSNAFTGMPTFELTLGELELEFDKQLTAVMGTMFGDEFASLGDLEPFVTTSVPLSLAVPKLVDRVQVSPLERDSPSVSGDSLSAALSTMGISGERPKAHDNITTSATRGPTSGFSTSRDKPPGLSSSIYVSSYGDDEDTITRSTSMAAPLPIFSSGSTHRSASEPTVRAGNEASDEPITRSTNLASVSSGPYDILPSSEPTLRSTNEALDSQETITRPTKPAVLQAYGILLSSEPTLRSTKEALDSQETITRPTKLAALQAVPDDRRTTFSGTSTAISAQTFGAGAFPFHTILPPVSDSPPAPHVGGFHTSHPTSYSTPLRPPEMSPDLRTGTVKEDIEMSCSDPPPAVFRVSGSVQGIPNQNAALEVNSNGWQQAVPASSWAAQSNIVFNSSATPTHESCAPQVPLSTSAAYPFDPATLCTAYTVPNYSYPSLTLPLPHPSIFELIRPDSLYLASGASAVPYVIPPAIVPDHVWQEEMAREQRRRLRGRLAEPSRRPRVSAPYFSRTPLVLKQGKKFKAHANASGPHTPGCNSTPRTEERPPSPASSCSSIDSSSSGASFASTSTSRSYDNRKLSSPPPFGKRRRYEKPVSAPRGVLGALRSMSWLWSWQG
ncbi:hypothetical protein DFH09DRAFT_1085100 [Mycena vulgaris]|nr:hypothetical protein DFH09DRAFT_1085100 [Mycena vulgaris]